MGTEDWVLKGTKLITNTKKQRLKIQSRGWILKNTILKGKKVTKNIIDIYEVGFKNSIFFCKVMVIKVKIKGAIEDLKIKNIKE